MTKKNLLLTLSLPAMLFQAAQAQTAHVAASVYHQHNPLAKYQARHNVAAKTTDASTSRLVGIANMTNNGAQFLPSDSIALNYSGNRGGDLTHQLKYDDATDWAYMNSAYANSGHYLQYFDLNDNLTNSISQSADTAGNWVNQYQTIYTYDANGNVATVITQSWNTTNVAWDNNTRDIYSYTPDNMPYSVVSQTWSTSSSTWTASSQNTLFYNSNGQFVSEIGQTYDAGTATWMYTYKDNTTYDGAGNVTELDYQSWNSTTNNWDNSFRNVYGYDSMSNNITNLTQIWNGSAWVNNSLTLYSNFVNMMPQNEVDQYWNADASMWMNSREYTFAYNDNGQMTYAVGESWNTGGFYEFAYGDPQSRYYYESTLAVNHIANNGGTATIFPVPATNMLNINLKWDNAQAFNVAIYDLQGRVMTQWSVPATAQYSTTISVNNFAAGNYIIKIAGAQGVIVKQLVVAH